MKTKSSSTRCPKKCLQDCLNKISGYKHAKGLRHISFKRGESVAPSGVQKHFSTISESQDKSKTILGYFFEEFEMMNNFISGSPQDLFIIFLV